ncbi:hypothetical protein Pedsa_0935 [Pseudopedobacter saltans DSM 12145]|uniref:Uncharacterized protein n=1 Tax=Pseudopedobacter saltans (strain ATCC 51119 / DSM 12145 / JCM 21818 / CCUG 39354 / LMG 10337 / NBRC 100064 / NCIMB 13643) TaxID=762903 RepID=F0SAD0_PSESL|nr:hypothetical protein [Pseudopedobacter saltans]ADY51507.1 hypothetical protein Pedsa_0935 [Pseudopedobacter saltans DSM 12145]
MKHILPFVIILFLFASCKKKENTSCTDNTFPIEKGTPPAPKIIEVKKEGNKRIISFTGKVTTIYFDRITPAGTTRFVYELQYDGLCQTSVIGSTSYEFKRTGAFTYTFNHSVSNGETNEFAIADFSGHYGFTTLDNAKY